MRSIVLSRGVVKRALRSYTRPDMATLITNIGELVTPIGSEALRGSAQGALDIRNDVEILIEDVTITRVGRRLDRRDSLEIVDAGGGVVLPGFVDAHTHAVFARSRDEEFLARATGIPYDGGGILASAAHVAECSEDELVSRSRPFLQRMLAHGTTTAEIKSGYGLSVDGEVKMLRAVRRLAETLPMRLVPTFLGAHAVPEDTSRDDYLALLIEEMIPRVKQEALATYCDVFCDRGFFSVDEARAVLVAARAAGMRPKLHADELADTGGAALAAELRATSADHLLCSSDRNLRRLAAAGVVAVLLPGTSFTLDVGYAPARRMVAMEIPVALATDFNPGSCPIYSIPVILSLAVTRLGLSIEEAITAATLNAAAALDLADVVGSIEEGKRADLLILDLERHQQIPYYFAHNPVRKVFSGGECRAGRDR
ncbi:MAG: imidazolonepropionase [Candidatus Bipolaricaulota bacterium]|nr:MAG: imidazolonepropionase [Candidatus Bipolaricaulota bacterium]